MFFLTYKSKTTYRINKKKLSPQRSLYKLFSEYFIFLVSLSVFDLSEKKDTQRLSKFSRKKYITYDTPCKIKKYLDFYLTINKLLSLAFQWYHNNFSEMHIKDFMSTVS